MLPRITYPLIALLLSSCGAGGGGSSITTVPSQTLSELTQFAYRGAFRVASGTFGESAADFAVGTLAYNPTNHSLFLAGSDQDMSIGEYPIPQLLDRPTLAELNVAFPRQNFRRILNEVANPEGIDRITGMLYVDGQLIVNAETWYDANGETDAIGGQDTTLVIRDAENLATSAIDGYYEMSGAATAAGYMAPIPPEWQADFGSEYMTGWSSVYSINFRYSIGPSLYTFDWNNLLYGAATSGPIASTPFMFYSFAGNWLDPEYLPARQGSAPALWNLLSKGVFGFIVPGTSTFAVFGSNGGIHSGIGYKITQDDGNVCAGNCAYAVADVYNYFWLFDVREILDASAVHDIQPYAYGKVSVPFDDNGQHAIVGGAFDPDTKMLYLTLANAGGVGQFDYTPLIVAYEAVF